MQIIRILYMYSQTAVTSVGSLADLTGSV